MSPIRRVWIAVYAAAMMAGLAPHAHAQQTVEAFYKGRDVQVLFGAGVGGTYGLYVQLAARHLRRHIPGQPNLIMQSMPGAGGNVALSYSYNVAPKDGSVIHLVHAEVLYETLLTDGVKFDAKGYQYIGRIADGDGVALTTKTSGARTLDEAKKREVTMGVTGFANIFALGPLMLNRTAGTRFRIIAGYKGAADITLAMQRGELDGSGMTLANALTSHADKLASGEFVPIFAIAAKRLERYPDVPTITEYGAAAEKTLMEIYTSTATIGRALAFPPGVPADRVAALRKAFAQMLDDAEFKAEVQKSGIPVAPMTGEELASYIATFAQASPNEIEVARRLHKELLAGK